MDRRFHKRHLTSVDAEVIAIEDPLQRARGQVSDISKSGISVDLPLRFAPGETVRLNFADSSAFGFVVRSEAKGAVFATGIEVHRVLLGGTDLSHLLEGILNEVMPGTPGLDRAEIYWG